LNVGRRWEFQRRFLNLFVIPIQQPKESLYLIFTAEIMISEILALFKASGAASGTRQISLGAL
jgi:hypothetical protein